MYLYGTTISALICIMADRPRLKPELLGDFLNSTKVSNNITLWTYVIPEGIPVCIAFHMLVRILHTSPHFQ